MTGPLTLEAICTFTDGPQQIARLPLFGLTSEANALHAVLSELSASERQSLLKLSLCLYGDDLDGWGWLEESRGKYYFTATAPKPEPERRINPDLVAGFKFSPSNKTAEAIFSAITPDLGVVVLDGATLSNGPMAGLVIKDCVGRFVVHIGCDGRLNAVPAGYHAESTEARQ
ncbi:hypothetical protein CKO42_25650 [Lamprobacter modestohalophilus]|uniref:Uncharacterized protein n=1 Tax=Lamprobacter modestohalophilus TaxID=1064514 RepID=A0A9X0WE26_9GAMM|nr:hypothetical protein [Lamprobacter modestohalophilus]MBK1621712.1 hypothetical protein [Lamprobacter modestohalophilus]